MAIITHRDNIVSYTTLDGSSIRELMYPQHHGNRLQSLAEATVHPGGATMLHTHTLSEEIYHVIAGCGVMILGETRFPIGIGDTVQIPPGMAHAVRNRGESDLVLLCCCSPPYSHLDTKLLGNPESE